MWRCLVEETRRRRTEEKVAPAREEGLENAGKCGKKLHKFKGHEDGGKLEGASRKEGKGKKSLVKLESKRVAVGKAARNLEGDNCSGRKGPEPYRGNIFFLGK